MEKSLRTAYSKEENVIVEHANKEVLRHLDALLFDACVHDKWSYEQLPMVQSIMKTVDKTSTEVTPIEVGAPPTSIGSTQQIVSPTQ